MHRGDAPRDIHTFGIYRPGLEGGQTGYFREFGAFPCSLYYSLPLLTQIREKYGNIDDQVELVAQQLKHLPQLSGGFDAMGFSQGVYRRRKGGAYYPFLMTTASRGAIS